MQIAWYHFKNGNIRLIYNRYVPPFFATCITPKTLSKLYKLKAGTAKTAYTFVSGFCLLRPSSTIRIYSVNAFSVSVIHQICENLYLPFSPDCTTLLFVIYTFSRLL